MRALRCFLSEFFATNSGEADVVHGGEGPPSAIATCHGRERRKPTTLHVCEVFVAMKDFLASSSLRETCEERAGREDDLR